MCKALYVCSTLQWHAVVQQAMSVHFCVTADAGLGMVGDADAQPSSRVSPVAEPPQTSCRGSGAMVIGPAARLTDDSQGVDSLVLNVSDACPHRFKVSPNQDGWPGGCRTSETVTASAFMCLALQMQGGAGP